MKKLIFIVSVLVQLLCTHKCTASIHLYNMTIGKIVHNLPDDPTGLGPSFPITGLKGHHVLLPVDDPCSPNLPPSPLGPVLWFAILQYNYTCHIRQILNIQTAGYSAAILYKFDIDDDDDDDGASLVLNNRDWNQSNSESIAFNHNSKINISIKIPSTYIGNSTKRVLALFAGKPNITTIIYQDYEDVSQLILILLGTLCLAIIIALLMFLVIYGCYRFYKMRKSLVTKWKLKWHPTHVYEKGDAYEVCVICLDEYVEGARLRILSCGHAFHCRCVDPWLVKSGRECPLCKRKADLRRRRGRKSQGDSDGGESSADERTALLGSQDHDDDDDNDDDGDGDDSGTDNPARLLDERQTTINAIVHSSDHQEQLGRRNYGATNTTGNDCPDVVVVGCNSRQPNRSQLSARSGKRDNAGENSSSDHPTVHHPSRQIHDTGSQFGHDPRPLLQPPQPGTFTHRPVQPTNQTNDEQSKATFYIGSVATDDGYPLEREEPIKLGHANLPQSEDQAEIGQVQPNAHQSQGSDVDSNCDADDDESEDDYYDVGHGDNAV